MNGTDSGPHRYDVRARGTRQARVSRSEVLALGYHGVSECWRSDLAVAPDLFEWQLRLLLGRGYRGVTFHEAVTDPPRGPCMAITFDDGYRSVIELAFPIMSRLGVLGTVFVPTDHAGTEQVMQWSGIEQWLGTSDERELIPMSWDELGQLADSGWEIGSHTRSHPHLTQVDQARLTAELDGSHEACEDQLGRRCLSISYPYGDVDDRVVQAARRAGYVAGAAMMPARTKPYSPLRWPRIGVFRPDGGWRFRLKTSPYDQTLRSSVAWRGGSHIRGALRRRASRHRLC
jgi:peptidoglycan/xylan/chitin deacetylase (PgdA/CDA1 family)